MASYVATGITVTFDAISAEIVDIQDGDEAVEIVDTTHQGSTSSYRTKLESLIDPGEATMTVHHGGTIPAAGTHATLTIDLTATGAPAGQQQLSVDAILSTVGGVQAQLGQKMIRELTFTKSGVPTWS